MMWPVELRSHEIGMLVGRSSRYRLGQDYAGQLHLELDGAILVEVPEEAVVVVAQRGDRGDDQPTGSSDLGLLGHPVVVLPQDPEVFLVDADRVTDRLGVAGRICDHAVEVANLAQAVTPGHQR